MKEGERELIDMAFNKMKADDRKIWLSNFEPGTYMNHDEQEEITITDFINKELILFSRADNERSIPSVLDVSSLSGAVLEQAAYHHSDASLHYRNGSRFCRFKQPSARYISVTIPDITRKIFNPQDDSLLSYRNDDGQLVEPEWYLPILPMILVNGSEGIGIEIVDNLIRNCTDVPVVLWVPGNILNDNPLKESFNRH
ncbi:17063_t:CDS:2 [Funneliformis geosporum]|nr:17063_t:CDS:2 [Funneliformis geosporum]